MNKKSALVIGLDGATFDIIKPILEAGRLPTFARLMAKGVWGGLRSILLPVTPSAWTSFMAGRNLGKHGVSGFYAFINGSYETQIVTGQSN